MNSLLAKAQKKEFERKIVGNHPCKNCQYDDAFCMKYFFGLVIACSAANCSSDKKIEVLRKHWVALGLKESDAASILKDVSSKKTDALLEEIGLVIIELAQKQRGIFFLEELTCLWSECAGEKRDLFEFRSSIARRLSLQADALGVLAVLDKALDEKDGKSLNALMNVIPLSDFQYLLSGLIDDAEKIVKDYIETKRRQKEQEATRIRNKPAHRLALVAMLQKIEANDSKFRDQVNIDSLLLREIEECAKNIDPENIDWAETIYNFFDHSLGSESISLRSCVWQVLFLTLVKERNDEKILPDFVKIMDAINKKYNYDYGVKFRAVFMKYFKDEIVPKGKR